MQARRDLPVHAPRISYSALVSTTTVLWFPQKLETEHLAENPLQAKLLYLALHAEINKAVHENPLFSNVTEITILYVLTLHGFKSHF